MRILFAGVELAGWSSNPAKNVLVNGAQVVNVVDVVGAANKRLYARGNSLITLTFGVTRIFDTLKEAEVFVLAHFDTMTKTGTCEVQCGWSTDYQSVYLYNAVVEASPVTSHRGLCVDVAYQIKAAKATTSAPPQFLIDDSNRMILVGLDTVSNGATYHDITFSSPFVSAPIVVANVAVPSGGNHIWATVRHDLTTIDGSRVEFSGPIPASGTYKLAWNAAI